MTRSKLEADYVTFCGGYAVRREGEAWANSNVMSCSKRGCEESANANRECRFHLGKLCLCRRTGVLVDADFMIVCGCERSEQNECVVDEP